MLAVRASLLAVFALISCALAIDLARAQGPTAETGTTLHPGVNLVGWVGEATPVSQLFDEIPQLESIWAWDAELRDWIVAGRAAPEWLGGLGRVTPGIGLRLHLGGDESYLWQRPTEPTRGLVKLRTGWNLVAWSGADQTPINDAVKGIGWSLRTVRRWNPATQQWTSWTSPKRTAQLIAAGSADQGADDDSEMPGIRRGEALWIEVARAVNWLQPTDILPRLVFPGGASQQLQTRVREDLEAVLTFYRDQYGIQADPDLTIYIPKDADALIQAYRDDGMNVDSADEASNRAEWGRAAGWFGAAGLVVKQELWSEELASSDPQYGTYVLAHEYTHVIQDGLRGRGNRSNAWLLEGGAEWAVSEFDDLNGVQSLDDRRESLLRGIRSDIPTLRSAEVPHGGPVYRLGEFAIDRLVGEYGADSWIEFWRRLAPTEAGPHERWQSTPDWQTALSKVTGIAVSEFYANFNAWQREQALKNAALGPAYHGRWIRGRVINSDRHPVGGAFVTAMSVGGERNRTEAAADGRFEVIAPEPGDYRLLVAVGDRCAGYYSSGELVTKEENAALIRVSDSDVPDIDIRLSPNVCGQIVRGQVVSDAGEPLAGVSIYCGRGCWYFHRTASDGTFTVAVENRDNYWLDFYIADGCVIRYRPGEPILYRDDGGTPIAIADNDVNGLRVRVSSDLCRQRVVGSIEGIERFTERFSTYLEVSVRLCRAGSTRCGQRTSRDLDRDGSFAVAAPTAGSYWLSYFLDNCQLYHTPTGLTGNPAEAMRFNAGEHDVRIGHRRVSDTMCAHRISGRLIGSDGPTTVYACEQLDRECASSAGGWADRDGRFAVTVPVDGAYRLYLNLPDCTAYFGQDGLTSNVDDAQLFRVDGRDIQISPRQVSAGGCGHQITGSITQADSRPLAGAYVTACLEVDGECTSHTGDNTDNDGAFAITVPVDGTYHVSFDLDGCTVHFGQGRLTGNRDDARLIRVAGRNVQLSQRQVPVDVCGYQITGSITQADGQPLADTQIFVCLEVGGHCGGGWASASTNSGGAFAITVAGDGRYLVWFEIERCIIHFRSGSFTTTRSERGTVRVEGRSVRLNPRQIPAGMCAHRISGRIVDSKGMLIPGEWIEAQWSSGAHIDAASGSIDTDGRFEIRVPSDGAYTLGVVLRERTDCWYQPGGRAFGSWDNPVRVSGADVTDITLRLPGTVEELCE